MNKESKTFPASVDSLEPIRDFVSEKSALAGINTKKNYGLCLAIDEIATNIVKYGYPKADIADGDIDVEIISENDYLRVVLTDNAAPFDPMEHLVPNEEDMSKPLEERPIGGLGILLAKQSVDKFEYQYVEDKNNNIFTVYKI